VGLDSLMAVELRNVIMRDTAEDLPVTLLFDYPSLADLGAFLLPRLYGSPEAPDGAIVRPTAAPAALGDDALAEVEQMSDDEIDRLFVSRLGRAHP
jgi:hypothetical protein